MTYLPWLDSNYYISRADSLPVNPGGWVPAITTDRPGQWIYLISCMSEDVNSPSTPDSYIECSLRYNYGGLREQIRYYIGNTGARRIYYRYGTMEYMAAGINWDFNVGTYFVSLGTWTIYQYLFFIPTAQYRGL
jgi:hypothetical protein